MFIIVCASTPRSSVKIGCGTPAEARAKMQELEDAAIGKVRAFTAEGKRLSSDDLSALIAASVPTTGAVAAG